MPQTVQAAPLTPQAPVLLPALHNPLEQQPPLQAVWPAPPHKLEHRWLPVLHA
jgi:hypothetical protein